MATQQRTQDQPRWFLLSYDAGEEITRTRLNEQNQAVQITERKHTTEDFRKQIIRTLLKADIIEMQEPVETSILFLDPRVGLSEIERINFWKDLFDKYGQDFYYIIVSVLQFLDGKPVRKENSNSELNNNFQRLLDKVINE